jgi:hypothetical protein
VKARLTLVSHLRVGVDALDLRTLDDTAGGHLLAHKDDELEGGVARLFVDLLGAEDGLRRKVGDQVELV